MSNNITKTKIIEAAEELFLTNDFKDISIRKICTLAGVSYGSFYHQIKSKENLLVMIRENAVKEGEKIFHSIPSLGIMEKTRRRVEEPKE